VCMLIFFASCMQQHAYEKNVQKLSDSSMKKVLTDVFLTESYLNERYRSDNPNLLPALKQSSYKWIFKKHHIDSADFYSTIDYYNAHPDIFVQVLMQVDSILTKIKPLDTSTVQQQIVDTIPNIRSVLNFRGNKNTLHELYDRKQTLRKNKQKETEI